MRLLRRTPPGLPLPNDTPVGGRPTLEGSGLDGGLRLVAVPLAPALCGHFAAAGLPAGGVVISSFSLQLPACTPVGP